MVTRMEKPPEKNLSAAEAEWVRQQMCKQSRMRWVWKTVRTWASWIGAAVMALVAMADAIKRLFER